MSKIIKNIKSWVADWFSVGSWEDKYWHAPANSVAAGDPAHGVQTSRDSDCLPPVINIGNEPVKTYDFHQFNVDGSSMSPERISNGDTLLCSMVSQEERDSLPSGLYVIVKADKDYYARKHKHVRFDHKLRRTVTRVRKQESFEQLVARLESENIEDSVLLDCNKKALKEKFEESHRYYEDFDSMMLSVTYREGQIRYSFHPSSLIEYKAIYVVSPKKGMNNTRKL
ncbi:MAG: hypothetical protein K2K98_06675 [Muribaculaceae bacterium]|nr:hypothetical protein [Muribaculaceae bacterium]